MRLEYFELIDRVEAIDLDALTVRVSGTLPASSPVFDGHFPKFPVLPGVMMLEFMNHAAGYLLLRRHDCEKFVFLGGVKRSKFRRFVLPGDAMTVTAKITHDGSGYAIAETAVVVKGEVAADAEVVMISTDFPTAELAAEIRRRLALIPVAAVANA